MWVYTFCLFFYHFTKANVYKWLADIKSYLAQSVLTFLLEMGTLGSLIVIKFKFHHIIYTFSDPYRERRLDDPYRARDPYDDRRPLLRGGLLGRDPSSIDPLSRGGGYTAQPAEVIDYSHRQANVSLPPGRK